MQKQIEVVMKSQMEEEMTNKEDKFRYTSMPTASADNLGQVVQYLGESTQTYTSGYFYKCVLEDNTYKWEKLNTQSNDITLSDSDISDIKRAFDTALKGE